ncbi:MAG: aspartate--tRNA ligase [Desulfatibacillaceae bacterium]|nr:aspartate--tRNA ligase [Desulfatibacillaceae bacterium]
MTESLGSLRRTHSCSALTQKDVGSTVVLMGWVQRRRDHGGVIFVDLRDREGITQVVFNPEHNPKVHEKAGDIRSEWVIAVVGKVVARPDGMVNESLFTGQIEVMVDELRLLNRSETPPFLLDEWAGVSELVRLKNRFLDLRRPQMVQNFVRRHNSAQCIRAFLNANGFLELETPVLTRSTPEGARDYLVPSRVNPGLFYALPQSPQLFKQLFMVAGYDRYYQIVKCFRDEDLRADRQPEFTQVDMEMSFVGEEDIMAISQNMMARLFDEVLGVKVKTPFFRLTYAQAMESYGLDKPDLRFGLPLVNVTDIVKDASFKVFADVARSGGLVKGINAKGCIDFSRKEIDDLTAFAAVYGARGLAWIKVKENEWQSPIAKFFSDQEKQALKEALNMEPGDLVFFVADVPKVANEALGQLRNRLGQRLELVKNDDFNFLWVTEFPLLEYDDEAKRFVALHHPFTAPMDEDLALLDSAPLSVRSRAYDMVLNGTEIGGGSIRIHNRNMQEKVFAALNIGPDEAEDKFGFLLQALQYGAPPHGGLAFGFDRLVAMMCGERSIREVIAFPKTQKAACIMAGAPSQVSSAQLAELGLKVR